MCVFFKPGFPGPDKSKAIFAWKQAHAGSAPLTHIFWQQAFLIWRYRFICSWSKNTEWKVISGFRLWGMFDRTAVCTFCFLPSVHAPLKYGNLSCIICNERTKSARKSFVPSVLQRYARDICWILSVLCCRSVHIPLPCVLVWQSKHCKVQEGPKKKVCQVIRFDEWRRKRPFIGSCRRGCVWLQRLLKAQLLFSAHTDI